MRVQLGVASIAPAPERAMYLIYGGLVVRVKVRSDQLELERRQQHTELG